MVETLIYWDKDSEMRGVVGFEHEQLFSVAAGTKTGSIFFCSGV